MKRRLYYYGEDVLSKSFLILPKELVFTKSLANMSAKSKILYCVLRERLMLSARNNWTDENGRIYIIYSNRKNSRRSVLQQGNNHAYDGRTRAPWTDRKTEARTGKPNLVYLCNSCRLSQNYVRSRH